MTATTVPYTDLPGQCQQITPELGITATPALDTTTGTIYVAAMTKETVVVPNATPNYYQRLHALDITSGAEKANSPVTVEAAVPGTGDGGTTVTFVPLDYKERPGLVLLNGIVYTSWSSHCDVEPYHGWVIGYDATTLAQVNVYNVTANGQEASFWDGGAAPAVDAAGSLYIGAGNGTFDVQNADGSANPAGVDIGESFIRLSTAGNHLAAADWFTPFNKDELNARESRHGFGGHDPLRRGQRAPDDQRGQGGPHLHPQPRQPRPLYAQRGHGRGADGWSKGLLASPAGYSAARRFFRARRKGRRCISARWATIRGRSCSTRRRAS